MASVRIGTRIQVRFVLSVLTLRLMSERRTFQLSRLVACLHFLLDNMSCVHAGTPLFAVDTSILQHVCEALNQSTVGGYDALDETFSW